MSWRGRGEGRTRWGDDHRDIRDREPRDNRWRARSPTWERRDNRDRYERRHDDRREPPRDRDRDRERDRRRDRERERREEEPIPNPPTPPTISHRGSRSKSKSMSIERDSEKEDDRETSMDREREENPTAVNLSPGDWFCKCGSYNFKRRQICYRRNCFGKRSEGTIYGGDNERILEQSGITKRLLFRRLDALTTEEKILESIKDRCSKAILDSIAGITIGRETLTGASKCMAYINFNSIADSTAAHTELLTLHPPLKIDGRDVLISYYNEPQKPPKPDYSNYYAQMNYTNTNTQGMSEADRVNAAAAVAQSAINAAQARNYTWTPTAVPTFVTTATKIAPTQIPTGDGKTVFTAPDVRTFLYDETSGYYYDPATGLYYDGNTQYFFNNHTSQYMYWDASTCTYIAATQTQQNTEQPKLPNPPQATVENTIVKEPEEKKKKKEDQVKVAKKIAKDMERWARTLNQKKENARSNVVMEQHFDNTASKGSADIGFTVLGAGPSVVHNTPLIREISPPPTPQVSDEFLMKKTEVDSFDSDDGIIDWGKLTCLLCKRKFPSPDVLNKHKTMSDLHKQNLAEYRKREELMPQPNGYRDRAAERRMKFGEDEPIINKRYVPEPASVVPTLSAPPPNVADTIGGKMLQKMGWSEGRGLGKTEQGRTAPIEAEQRPALIGLGQKKGIYTPTPGETYRDTVKKLMIARYREVIGNED